MARHRSDCWTPTFEYVFDENRTLYHVGGNLSVGGGVEFTLRERAGTPSSPEPTRFAVTPYMANNIVGDVQSGRVGLGTSLAFFPWKHFGFELDGELHGHFFRALVDENRSDGGYFKDYGLLRLSAGVSVGF